jgi:hypothetical protein
LKLYVVPEETEDGMRKLDPPSSQERDYVVASMRKCER